MDATHFHVNVAPPSAGTIALELQNDFNGLLQNLASNFANGFDLSPSAVPLLTSGLGGLFSLAPALGGAVPELDLSQALGGSTMAPLSDEIVMPQLDSGSIPTMADLAAALIAAGYTVDSIADDSTLYAAISETDLVRVSRTFTLSGLRVTTPLTSTGLEDSTDFEGYSPNGNLDASGDFSFTVTFGVDTNGFYLLSGSGLSGTIQASGNASGTVAGGTLTGTATVNVNPAIALTTTNADGKLRLSDLVQSFASDITTSLAGNASLSLGYQFPISNTTPVQFSGGWSWGIDDSGYHLTSGSGFDAQSLLGSLIQAEIPGITNLAGQSSTIAQMVKGIPLIGQTLADGLTPVISSGLSFDPGDGDLLAYFAGWATSYSALTPYDFVSGAYHNEDLLQVQVHHVESLLNANLAASGTASFSPGGVNMGFNLSGSISFNPTVTIDATFGIDANGPYVEDGGTVAAALVVSGQLSGSAYIGDLARVTAKATANLTGANVALALQGPNGASGQKLYLSDSIDLAADAVTRAGTLVLDPVRLSLDNPASSIPIVGDLLPSFGWNATASYDLQTGVFNYQVTQDQTFTDLVNQFSNTDLKDAFIHKLVGNIPRYDPIPESVINFLNKAMDIVEHHQPGGREHFGHC